jgi:sugar-specific transcriptional regulator TrmB/CheY-like chemotaxis protein
MDMQLNLQGKDALSKAMALSYDVFLIDINLPDIEGTDLLMQLQQINPSAIKIMITGMPSAENAIKSLNIGASSFLTKPLDPSVLRRTIKEKLKQKSLNTYSDKNLAQSTKVKISKIQSNEYRNFVEEVATMFMTFGLNKTKSRIYTAINVLGAATVSEIAMLSKIRREEVYRVLPELEGTGIVSSRLESPRKFFAIDAKATVEELITLKTNLMKRELDLLESKKDQLISKLNSTSFGFYEENTIEVLARQENIETKMVQMVNKAKNSIIFTGPIDELVGILEVKSKSCENIFENQVEIRIILNNNELGENEVGAGSTLRSLRLLSSKINFIFELKKVDKTPFKVLVIDRKEAIWGETRAREHFTRFLWTNDPFQIGILKRAFENLWQEA